MKYKLVVLVFFFLIVIVFSQFTHEAIGKREERRYKDEFMKITDVKEMVNFMYYEGYTHAIIKLKDETRISIWHFNESTFANTEKIELSGINDISVKCDLGKDMLGTTTGFNTIEYVQMKKPSLQFRNLQELLTHHDTIYQLFKLLPQEIEKAEKLDFKTRTLWCIRVPWKDNNY